MFMFTLVIARAVEFPIMDHLKDAETLQQAKLSGLEVNQILAQVERTAYDTPASWQKELRARRTSLGSVNGLILEGTSLLCGATGNCQTWIFRLEGRSWVCLFRGQAPIADGFGFEQHTATKGIRNLVLSTHVSADETSYSVFTYDGQTYSSSQCYRVIAGRAKETSCK
jgi:hypothetical protein